MDQEGEPSKHVSDPKAAGRWREQGRDVRRKQLLAERRVKQLEPRTIETIQSGGSSEPEKSIDCLCQSDRPLRGVFLESPEIMTDLEAWQRLGLSSNRCLK